MEESTFGEVIKVARTEKKLSLRELARRIDVSHPYLSQLENGHNNNPSAEIIYKLADSLGISFAYLLSLTERDPGYSDLFHSETYSLLKFLGWEDLRTIVNFSDSEFEEWIKEMGLDNNTESTDNIRFVINKLYQLEDKAKNITHAQSFVEQRKNEIELGEKSGIPLKAALLIGTKGLPLVVNNYILTDEDKTKLLKIAEIMFGEQE
ncbi:hypothetical protein CSV77_03670 [Sporosarcina sp. P16b]|uniref:helix-turn-helix domain-containing protein n=1 Tax=Sporosarcina sp. P16b TaxID=2048261 RepID=UPI000C167D96|nr:helix-turn-helix transcriptional regulator [Sporosarcina sp. P16b]PIC71149.1 hypothetical protein CSV77_03670 [Sporosarcina sp. P16b]